MRRDERAASRAASPKLPGLFSSGPPPQPRTGMRQVNQGKLRTHGASVSLAEKVEQFLKERCGQWQDGRAIAAVGGIYAWRSRLSDLRRPPFSLNIENRLRRCTDERGRKFVVSEYRLLESEPRA